MRDVDEYRQELRSVALNNFETVRKRAGPAHVAVKEASPPPPPATHPGMLMAAEATVPPEYLRWK